MISILIIYIFRPIKYCQYLTTYCYMQFYYIVLCSPSYIICPDDCIRVQCWRAQAKRQTFLTAEGRTPYVANIIWQPSGARWVYSRCTHRQYTVYILSIMYIENSINTALLHYVIVYKIGMKHRHKLISKCFYFLGIYILRNYFMLN